MPCAGEQALMPEKALKAESQVCVVRSLSLVCLGVVNATEDVGTALTTYATEVIHKEWLRKKNMRSLGS